jgi:hypothetical protein
MLQTEFTIRTILPYVSGMSISILRNGFHTLKILKFSSYLTGNTLRPRYGAQLVMQFRETVAVYCENHTEHTDTLCGQNAVRTSQETHYVSPT